MVLLLLQRATENVSFQRFTDTLSSLSSRDPGSNPGRGTSFPLMEAKKRSLYRGVNGTATLIFGTASPSYK